MKNWIKEMIFDNNFFFATMPVKDGTVVFPIHKGGWSLEDKDLWEIFEQKKCLKKINS